jgi:hypothetical protein
MELSRSSEAVSFFLGVGWDWVHLVRRPLTGLLYQPRMIDECAVGGMIIGRGNRSTPRKPAPVPLCPSQIPHDLDLGSNPGSRWLTAWAMARLLLMCYGQNKLICWSLLLGGFQRANEWIGCLISCLLSCYAKH